MANTGAEAHTEPVKRTYGGVLRLLSARDIMNVQVKNLEGEILGTIEELMIDLNNGRIVYAVLSFQGILGIGDKYFAIPWEAISIPLEEKVFILNVEREKLEKAPGFNKDEWPMRGDWAMIGSSSAGKP